MTTPGLPGAPWGNTPLPGLPFVPAPQDLPGVAQALDISEGIGAVRRWVSDRHNWVRVAWFAGGVVLMMSGAGLIAGKKAGTAVIKVVDKVV